MIAGLRTILVVASFVLSRGALFAQSEGRHYGLRYDLTLRPADDRAEVSLTIDERAKDNIWAMRFHIDPERHTAFEGDGRIEPNGPYVTWTLPKNGGRFSFRVAVSHRRDNGRFDARMTDEWAIFRGDDLFPPARTDQHDEAEADATLHVQLPEKWSFVAPYPTKGATQGGQAHFAPRTAHDHRGNGARPVPVYEIEHADRLFDRPTGWMAAGRLGVRREQIAGVQVVVAGPVNQGVRRMDILALLNWNLPEARRLVPKMPKRLVVVSAGDPMWRGGLSGPGSLFIHAERPLLSENGTSTLVHELVHVANRLTAESKGDWIVEGLAEYYSLKLMWRSGTITDNRYQAIFRNLEKWALDAERLDVERSSGAVTARAVGVMRKLDREIHTKTERKKSLDDVVRHLMIAKRKVNRDRFSQAVVEIMGEPADALSDEQLGF